MKTLEIVEDENGELALQLTPDILKQMGWVEGDEIEWIDNQDGSWSLKKVNDDKG